MLKARDADGFKNIELADKVFFDSLNMNSLSCEKNFNAVFCWARILDSRWTCFKGHTLVYYGKENCCIIADDLAKVDELREISDYLISQGLYGDFYDIELSFARAHEKYLQKYFEIDYCEDFDDYIYSVDELVALSGRKLQKKRNLIRQFKRNNSDFTVSPMEKTLLPLCRDFCGSLHDHNTASAGQNEEFAAINRAFDHFELLDMQGVVLMAGDKIAALCIFDSINARCADIFFERISRDHKGAGPLLNHETAKILKKQGFSLVNREQDLGLINLRRAKRSYAPRLMYSRCTLKRR